MKFEELAEVSPELKILKTNPIAYFCAEFALTDDLPIYSGGLGVLAGDVIRQADASDIPLVGIGLLYKEGYFTQVISEDGSQSELPAFLGTKSNLKQLRNSDGTPRHIELPIGQRIVCLNVWKYKEGAIDVYLLDTDVEENSASDRRLTLSLYPSDHEWRIQQEIVLGIGGARVLHELGLSPSIYHLNEGHSAFVVLEVTRQIMETDKFSFEKALSGACNKIVFTNHTLVASGNDAFHKDMVERLLGQYALPSKLPFAKILEMGQIPTDQNYFSMTQLALSESKKASAVSQSHARFARQAWPEKNLEPITNGVFAPYWQAEGWRKIAESLLAGFEVSDEDLWETHQNYKHALSQKIADITGTRLNPHILTITWAKRIAVYKQPLLLFLEMDKLREILFDSEKPLQIIISGKAHPGDLAAKAVVEKIIQLISASDLKNKIAFLPNYNLETAKILLQGSDVWLNTPEKGREACGTSGMKSALNGVLQCAISDGWTDEINLESSGFSISPMSSAQSLYDILRTQAAPLYYDKAEGHRPKDWCEKMRKTILQAYPKFTTERMLAEYFEKLYAPVLLAQKQN